MIVFMQKIQLWSLDFLGSYKNLPKYCFLVVTYSSNITLWSMMFATITE